MVERITDIWDAVGRGMMLVAAAAGLYATIDAILHLTAIGPDRTWIEIWRTVGYATFALMFLLVALRPRRSPGIWELSFLNKAALGMSSHFVTRVPEAMPAGIVDGSLAVITIVAYLLTRGWQGWRR